MLMSQMIQFRRNKDDHHSWQRKLGLRARNILFVVAVLRSSLALELHLSCVRWAHHTLTLGFRDAQDGSHLLLLLLQDQLVAELLFEVAATKLRQANRLLSSLCFHFGPVST